jgi:SAM-dependent methyltransferase
MTTSPDIYNDRATDYFKQYESLRFEEVHKAIVDYVPKKPSLVLDVGAGSGRDAAWFAAQGHYVVAIEPAIKLRILAKEKHPSPNIKWIDDSLPNLTASHQLGYFFDFILLSAVWMHVPEIQRDLAFGRLITLLKPGGRIAISLRLGPIDHARQMYPVSVAELKLLAASHGADIIREVHSEDVLGRKEIAWAVVVIGVA